MKIGEILVQKGYVTQQQVDGVLAVKGDDAQVGQVLIQWGMITQEQLMEALDIQAPPPPPPPPPPPAQPQQPMYQQPPVAPPPSAPDLTMDNLQTSKFNIDLKTMIYIGSILVSGITMYFTFMSELDSRFGALESQDNTLVVDIDKRLTELETTLDKRVTELENKFTPIGDGVYAVDPNSSWPPSRGEYKMKDEMSRNKIMTLENEIQELKEEIEDLEDKLDK
jgi:hypothetical protein